MNIKKLFAFIAAAAIFSSNTASAIYNAENNVVARRTVHTISPGLIYTSSVEVCEDKRQEIYTFNYTPSSETSIVAAYGQYIYGFNSVGQLISSYDGEGRVVGGINTDFYITSTGIPLSCLVSDKEVISTCDNRAALGFDENGNAIIGYPKISAKITSENLELPVAHINKVPAIWGMYLVTDQFYSSTKSSLDSIEIIFRPFDKVKTDLNIKGEDAESTESDETSAPENLQEVNLSQDIESNNIVENNDVTENNNGSEEHLESDTTASENNDDELDNEHTEEIPEESEDESGSEEDTQKFNFDNYVFTSQNAEIGGEIDIVVTDIFDGVQNSEIPKDSFVLCIPKEQFGHKVDGIKIGDEFKLKVSVDEAFSECTDIFGAGSIILKDGGFVEQTNDSIYSYKNPRTAAGIRPDGSVVFVCVDGRRKGESEGFTITELADYLRDMGCTYAVNFDGGGSTTFYAADIGESKASLKNTPSEGVERRVADGLIFVNNSKPDGIAKYASLYPNEFLVYYKDAQEIIYGDLKLADGNYYPVDIPEGEISFSVDSRYGSTEEGIFTPNGTVGKAEIIATIEDNIGVSEFSVGFVTITDKVNKINFSAQDNVISPFATGTYLDVSAFLNTIPVTLSPYSVDWSIAIEKVGQDGEVTYENVGTEYALIDAEKMLFVPFVKGEKYILTASVGDFSEKLEISVDALPYEDMFGHWAAETSYDMFKKHLITGELNDMDIRNFLPDRNMTRAEFCVVLARILELNVITEASENYDNNTDASLEEIADSKMIGTIENEPNVLDALNEEVTDLSGTYDFPDVPGWAKPYVNALYESGHLSHLVVYDEQGTPTINASDYITRNDVIRVLGSLLEIDAETEVSSQYTDFIPESEEDVLCFSKAISSGIIKGYEDGTIRQYSSLTRAEAATVFSRFYSIYKPVTGLE